MGQSGRVLGQGAEAGQQGGHRLGPLSEPFPRALRGFHPGASAPHLGRWGETHGHLPCYSRGVVDKLPHLREGHFPRLYPRGSAAPALQGSGTLLHLARNKGSVSIRSGSRVRARTAVVICELWPSALLALPSLQTWRGMGLPQKGRSPSRDS